MEGSAVGYEINIYQNDIKKSDIKTPSDFFNAVKEIIYDFSESRICNPADLVFEDEDYNEIEHQQKVISDYIVASDESITVVHYFAATDATYTFEYTDNESPIKSEGMTFRGMTLVDTDFIHEFKKGSQILELELQGTGDAPIEETVIYWVDKDGKQQSASTEHYVHDGLTDEQEADLRELTDSLFEEIFK